MSDIDPPITFAEYLEMVRAARFINPSWRNGQTHFNILHTYRPDLAELIRGTSIDPFHRDCVLADFLYRVGVMW